MTIRAVLVDGGGVLVVPHDEPVVAALDTARVRLQGPDFERAHFLAMASVDRGVPASGPEPPYIQAYAAALGIWPVEQERAVAARSELFAAPACTVWRRTLRESVEGFRRLAERPLPVGIVSNADGTVEELLLRTGICQLGTGARTDHLCPEPDGHCHITALDELQLA